MSADNSILIVQNKDGYRVAHVQSQDNLFLHPLCCDNPNIQDQSEIYQEDLCYHEECANCGTIDPEWEERDKINPSIFYDWFKDSDVYKTKEEAMEMADIILNEVMFVEYGIQFIDEL